VPKGSKSVVHIEKVDPTGTPKETKGKGERPGSFDDNIPIQFVGKNLKRVACYGSLEGKHPENTAPKKPKSPKTI